jgi:hypothetical protein
MEPPELVANPQTCDQMVEIFKPYRPSVIRREVAGELHQRLEALHRRVAQGAPAMQ